MFGAGIWFLFRLFGQPPQAHEAGCPGASRSAPPASRRQPRRVDRTRLRSGHDARSAGDLGAAHRRRGVPLRLLDGFDLGIGILFPAFEGRDERDLAVNTVAPVWDGNETWLVLGGGGLFAVFPLAYATILPALYMPLILMLLALIFRGVAFEMRFRAETATSQRVVGPRLLGAAVAAFCQGIALGALVQGIGWRTRLCRRLVGLAYRRSPS